jgi:hypothetical protein
MNDLDILKEEAKHNAIVAGVLLAGGDAIDCVKALCQVNKENVNRLIKLDMLVPRKIKSGDKVFIWRCPEELIPESEVEDVWPTPKLETKRQKKVTK